MPSFHKFTLFFRCLLLTCGGGLWAVATGNAQPLQQPSGPNSNIQRCRAIADDAARLRCFEDATAKPVLPTQAADPSKASGAPVVLGPGAGTWRLVRTPNPAGGKDAVSIFQIADIAKSDIDLVGLMIRCGQPNLETLLVLVSPLPPRAHRKVTLSASGTSQDFTGTIVSPGAAILLPKDATALASSSWKAAPELAVQIDNESDRIKGVIPLTGLKAALPVLLANCPPL
jgi:hypothetical protein